LSIQSIVHLLGRPTKATSLRQTPPRLHDAKGGRRAAKVSSVRGGSHVSGKLASPPKSPFAHLRPAIEPERETAAVTAPRPMSKAAAILAAAEKARQPTSAPKPTGTAAKIIAAAMRARGEA
jgi:hypothetical protein